MLIGIKRLFLLNSLITAILPIVFIGLISLVVIRHQIIQRIDESSVTLARSVANQITTYLQEPSATFNFLARHLDRQRHSDAEIAMLLDDLANSYSYFESVYLLDRHGTVKEVGFDKEAAVNKADYLGMDFSSLEICRQAVAEKRFLWQSTLSVSSGEPTISFCAPLGNGTVLATLSLAKLGAIINSASTGRTYDAFIVDSRGRIIAHPDSAVVQRQENISNLPIIRESLAGKTSSGNFAFHGKSYRGSAVSIEGFNWVLVVAQNLDVAMAPKAALEKVLMIGMLSVLLMALFVSSVASLMLSRPFKQLSDNARHVINEEYAHIKPISSRSLEITLLSETLQKMVDAVRARETLLSEQTEELMATEETLRDLNQNLEQRVNERTERLEEAMEELNRVNEDLMQRTTALEDANHYLESFAYSISHDLRAPLRHVSSFSAIVAEEYADKLDDTGREYLARIVKSCGKMDELINAILEFSRVTRQSLALLPVDMMSLAEEALSDFQAEIDHKGVEVVLGQLPKCTADRVLMKQVLVNLIGNALKYSRNKQNPRVEIGVSSQGKELLFFVKDNGAGFDMAAASKLFGVFSRLHRQDEFEGIGVGLAITHNIVQRHGGRIWAEAAPDQGATFWFTLPV
jgi:signal transduction histidine kinase